MSNENTKTDLSAKTKQLEEYVRNNNSLRIRKCDLNCNEVRKALNEMKVSLAMGNDISTADRLFLGLLLEAGEY